jgi:hypothetical protein
VATVLSPVAVAHALTVDRIGTDLAMAWPF